MVTAVLSQQNLHPTYKIVIAGHSLGAATARLTLFFFLQLKQFVNAVYELYTYGEPRVGNKQFVDFFNSQNIVSARSVNKYVNTEPEKNAKLYIMFDFSINRADIIPHFPPTSLLDTSLLYDYYIQTHAEFWIKSDTQQRFCNQSFYEDPTCSDSVGPNYNLADHFGYFGLNYTMCMSPDLLSGLPFNTTNPGDIPSLPQLIPTS